LGRRGGEAAEARRAGLDVVETERGGLATWHGPGQLVGYPIVRAAARGWAVKDVVAGVEDGLVGWLAGVGIQAARREGCPGVWVGDAKIASIGMHFRHGVSMHGFSLNLSLGDGAFAGIAPCGVASCPIASVEALSGRRLAPEDVAIEVGERALAAIVARSLDGRRGPRYVPGAEGM
ncbi:MAG TPA: lipoyl(octanoyl) transferase LipB, partial [Myxococcota bacterium]|nr:lipoyl(octanoyl) transferase LipB [Myxococcota bacterium]